MLFYVIVCIIQITTNLYRCNFHTISEANKYYFFYKKLKIKYKSSAHKFQAYIKTFCTRGKRYWKIRCENVEPTSCIRIIWHQKSNKIIASEKQQPNYLKFSLDYKYFVQAR